MKELRAALLPLALLAVSATAALAAPPADTLAEVKKRGVLVAGVKDSLAPFGCRDEKTGEIVGYDVDFVNALAKRLGVKVALKPVTSEDRIQRLKDGDVDLLAATMTKTRERAQQVDFSHAYFLTGQKFIAKKFKVFDFKDLEKRKVGTVKGSTSETNLRKEVPAALVVLFDDYPQAMKALEEGELDAITTDEPLLAALLASSPKKDQLEIPRLQISVEPYGLAMRKGDRKLVELVDKSLLDMEKSGEAKKIFDRWFGPASSCPLARTFKINGAADTPPPMLAGVKRRGVLVVGVKDAMPPFSFVAEKTRETVGYDVDFAKAIARALGVRLELKPVTSAERIPLLVDGSIDLVAATLTRTPEREREIDFSHSYFFDTQKVLVRKGTMKALTDLEGKKVGTARGTSSLEYLTQKVPAASAVAYDTYQEALAALERGELFGVTTGDLMLKGLLAKSPAKAQLEIARPVIHLDIYGLGMRKGDKEFVDFVNKTLLDLEKSGEAKRIFETWFGQTTEFPLLRSFKISAGM